jgi:hypothetical protein
MGQPLNYLFQKDLAKVSGREVLDKLLQDLQPQAKQRLQAIWLALDRLRAEMVL